jgi:hypothetical protein
MGKHGEWQKSSLCWANGDCVEVRHAGEIVEMRQSRSPAGPILRLDRSAWTAFVASIRAGHPMALSD